MTSGKLIWNATCREVLNSTQCNDLKEARKGVMVHYDGSGTDAGAISWFKHPDCKVSYQALVLDDGSWIQVAGWDKRAWHAGVCKPAGKVDYKDANSAFYGIAAATNEHYDVTVPQLITIAWLTWQRFKEHGWDPVKDAFRVVGHHEEAWPRGRKIDPQGLSKTNPIFIPKDIRDLLPLFE